MNTIRGNKCVFIHRGKNKRVDYDIRLFRFAKDDRCKEWIVNSGKY